MIFIAIFSVISNTASAYDKNYSWYIKRNGNKRPQIQPEQNIIYNYDGYYIDKKVTDDDSRKVIYLTFDLGYENGNTEKILDILCEEKIPAAFFVLDNIILKNTDLVTRMLDEGHLVCNHTKNHKNICNMSNEEIQKNITELENLFEEKTGQKIAKYFRFPEGKYSEKALKCIQALGYKTIFWSFAYDDWDNNRQPDKDKALRKILDNTHNGAVMLFHPTSRTNAEIFKQLILEWSEAGYSFGTLDELVL
ncbi:MAG: delta-lactam-biosynthetic de-N-acetylase [Ruminococcaceae bacterium]|nr:delta-lactam-biosynthetic de-N-acetylase [Oscillospiraceae bacterium]